MNNYATIIIPEKITAKSELIFNNANTNNDETTIIPEEIRESCSVPQNPNFTKVLKIYERVGDPVCTIPQDKFDKLEEVQMESSQESCRHLIHSKESVISASVSNHEEIFDDMEDSINDPDYIPSSDTEMVCNMLYFIEHCNRVFIKCIFKN